MGILPHHQRAWPTHSREGLSHDWYPYSSTALCRTTKMGGLAPKEKGRKKSTKIPYQPLNPTLTAASNDPSTWADAATAIAAAKDGNFSGIGICLLDSDLVILT